VAHLVMDGETDVILGCPIDGPEAPEMFQKAAIDQGPVRQLLRSAFPHGRRTRHPAREATTDDTERGVDAARPSTLGLGVQFSRCRNRAACQPAQSKQQKEQKPVDGNRLENEAKA
jgi:hypothetical protein